MIWIRAEGHQPILAMHSDGVIIRTLGELEEESPICYGASAFAMGSNVVAITYIQNERPGGSFSFKTRENRSETNQGTVKIEGRALKYKDEDIGIFKSVTWQNNRERIEDNAPLTWDESEWRWYFPNEEEFESLAIWNDKKKRFGYDLIYVTERFGKSLNKRCFQFSKRPPKSNQWKCFERQD